MKQSDLNYIYNYIKKAWSQDILQSDDLAGLAKQASHYTEILKHLSCLTIIPDTEEKEFKESNHIQSSKPNKDTYILKRNLYGGMGIKVDNASNMIFVPEKMIRREQLEHGDVFRYKKDSIGRGKHEFIKLLNTPKAEIPNHDIQNYNYAIVGFDRTLNTYVCRQYYKDGIIVSMPTLIIRKDDVLKFRLRVDDIVDVAHAPNKDRARVRWKYAASDPLPTPKSKKSGYYKTSQTTQSNDFKDIDIGVVGATSYIKGYREETEKRGGTLHHTDSDVMRQVERLVDKSDIVIIPIFQTSHAKMEFAKEKAKHQGKPFVILNNAGRTYFVETVQQHLSTINDDAQK